MSEDKMYTAMREFIREAVGHEVLKAAQPLHEQIRSLRTQLETRAAQVIEGPPGKDGKDGTPGTNGKDGRDGVDGKDGAPGIAQRGADGLNGKDGAPSTVPGPKGDTGERGTNGIATREELESIIEARMADIQVRTFADVYQGVYEPSRTYSRGLATTWGGSLWLSLTETRSKPGENADWRLVVKKGADGKK